MYLHVVYGYLAYLDEGSDDMNRILSISISLVLLLSIIVLSVILITSNNTGGAIMQEETALIIGRALLEERFPEIFSIEEVFVRAIDNNDTWKVYNVFEPRISEDGTVSVIFGLWVNVEFNKRDGTVLRFGTEIGQQDFTNAIAETETALEIGRALLEERFPEIFLIEGVSVNVVENRTTWRVHIVSDELKTLEDGSNDMYVEFRKRDGRILRFVPAN